MSGASNLLLVCCVVGVVLGSRIAARRRALIVTALISLILYIVASVPFEGLGRATVVAVSFPLCTLVGHYSGHRSGGASKIVKN